MKHVILSALISAWPAIGISATAVVTGGEHSDFTRLVVTLPREVDWRLGRVDGGYALSVAEVGLEYDLSRAFTRIPKTRLADVTQVPSSGDLHIVAACACYITAFAFRPNVVVLDIRDGVPPPDSNFEVALESFFEGEKSTSSLDGTSSLTGSTELALDWTSRLDERLPQSIPTAPTQVQLPQSFQEDIARQLGAAASEGLITLDTTQKRDDRYAETESEYVMKDSGEQFRVLTEPGMDLRLGEGVDQIVTTDEKCFPDDMVDVATWGEPNVKPTEYLSKIRTMLVTDSDRLADDAVTTAAKLYLYLGFGAEAQLVLSALPSLSREQVVLKDIGAILEGASPKEGIFNEMELCDNPSALWAMLSRDQLRKSEPVASGAIVQAFSSLPYPLRELLAARVIERFLELDDDLSAQMVRDTLGRVLAEMPSELRLSEAQIELRADRPEQAKNALEAASAMPNLDEAAALVALVDLNFSARKPVEADRIIMLEALLAQNRSLPVAEEIKTALVKAYGLSGDFSNANRFLAPSSSAVGPYWSLVSELGSDSQILNFAFEPPSEISAIDEKTKASLAKKFLDLGFPERSLLWLGHPNVDPKLLSNEMKEILAEAYLRLSDAEAALRLVAGTDESTNLIKFRAMLALGRLNEAATLIDANDDGMQYELDHLLKAARNWQTLAQNESGVWSEAASLVNEPEYDPNFNTSILLKDVSIIASKASESREMVVQLLSETQKSP